MEMESGKHGMKHLSRLIAPLFLVLSFNAFAVDTDGDGLDDSVETNTTASTEVYTYITPKFIFNNFPLCKIASSFGQACKYWPLRKRDAFSPSKIFDASEIKIADDMIDITTDDWFYSFSIKKLEGGVIELQFTDDATKGSYLTVSTFTLSWQEEDKNWTLTGKTLNYIAGGSDVKKMEDVYVTFDEAIPFIKSD